MFTVLILFFSLLAGQANPGHPAPYDVTGGPPTVVSTSAGALAPADVTGGPPTVVSTGSGVRAPADVTGGPAT